MLRVAAVGLRIHGHGGIAEVLSAGDAVLVAVAEEDEERRDRASGRYGVPAYADWWQMLDRESPDLVVVCPPHDQKAAVTLACLERGVHVLVDKPMAIAHRELDQLEQAVARGPGQVQMMLTERFNPTFVALKQLVDSGRLGAIAGCVAMRPHEFSVVQSEPWMWERRREGGIFLDLMIHDIDLVRWITGAEVVSVQASQAQKRFTPPGFHDVGQALFRLTGGAAASLEADWLVPTGAPWDCRFFVIGSEGTAEVAMLDRAGLWYWTAGQERQRVLAGARSPASSGADLVARIRGDGPTILSATDAVAATRAALYARDAADTETPVIVEVKEHK
jgi:predicted dehydrogenase